MHKNEPDSLFNRLMAQRFYNNFKLYDQNVSTSAPLVVNSAGIIKNNPEFQTNLPNGRVDYYLLYLLEGSMPFSFLEKKLSITARLLCHHSATLRLSLSFDPRLDRKIFFHPFYRFLGKGLFRAIRLWRPPLSAPCAALPRCHRALSSAVAILFSAKDLFRRRISSQSRFAPACACTAGAWRQNAGSHQSFPHLYRQPL